ncbi:AAA family ATPase [Streptomyces sp. NPDC005799]|uniref:AAA family ATPase n=1 Tax=Streptomyces sp. NPDC005799 TaxID=3154678 RepID=UPI0033C6F0D3
MIERDSELRLLERLVAKAKQEGRFQSVLIEGLPGTGRTELLRHAVTAAGRNGMRAAVALGTPGEMPLRYGIARQLLAAIERFERSGSRRPWAPEDQVIRALNRAAYRAPLLLAVDDAQWMDLQSWRWLGSMTRRSAASPVLVVVTAYPHALLPAASLDEPHGRHVSGALGPAPNVLRTRPLSRAGVAITAATHGSPDVHWTVDDLTEATAGNPSVLRSLLSMPTSAETPSDKCAELLSRVTDITGARIDRVLDGLSAELMDLLAALAVGGASLSGEPVCALAGLRSMSPQQALDLLAGSCLVTTEKPVICTPGTSERVLVRMTVAQRADLYARAAELGHRMAVPHHELARMLLGSRPIGASWAVRVLRQEAMLKVGTAPQAAAQLLRRALKEPATPHIQADIRADLRAVTGTGAHTADEPYTGPKPMSPDVLPFTLTSADEQVLRYSWTHAPHHRPDPDKATLTVRPRPGGRGDVPRPATPGPRTAPAQRVRGDAQDSNPLDPEKAALTAWRWSLSVSRPATDVAAMARFTLHAAVEHHVPFASRIAACLTLILTDDVAEAMSGLDHAAEDARSKGALLARALAFTARANAGVHGGWIGQAAADLETVAQVVPERLWPASLKNWITTLRVRLHTERGDIGAARQAAALLLRPSDDPQAPHALYSRGLLALYEGDVREARDAFLESGRHMLASGIMTPALLPWRLLASVTCQSLGETDRAAQLAAEEARLARAWGTPSSIAFASLTRGLVSPPDAGTEALAEASLILKKEPPVAWSAPIRARLLREVIDSATEQCAAGKPAISDTICFPNVIG